MRDLEREEWIGLRAAHQEKLAPWTEDRIRRSSVQKTHPVFDFLFDYYSFRPAYLLRWSPGINVRLKDTQTQETDWPDHFFPNGSGIALRESLITHRLPFLEWVTAYLTTIENRAPVFSCFGLHEWAMIYSDGSVRYPGINLRMKQKEIALVVDELQLRCSHYDAFRFFTPLSKIKNKHQLARETTPEFDQPGCVHVAMDLYKFAHKIAPFISAELIADTFLLAVKARILDMRASPYDLREFGFEPIKIEEIAGREYYVSEQRALFQEGQKFRQSLSRELLELKYLLQANISM